MSAVSSKCGSGTGLVPHHLLAHFWECVIDAVCNAKTQHRLLTDLSCDIIFDVITIYTPQLSVLFSPHQYHHCNHKNINCRSDWRAATQRLPPGSKHPRAATENIFSGTQCHVLSFTNNSTNGGKKKKTVL